MVRILMYWDGLFVTQTRACTTFRSAHCSQQQEDRLWRSHVQAVQRYSLFQRACCQVASSAACECLQSTAALCHGTALTTSCSCRHWRSQHLRNMTPCSLLMGAFCRSSTGRNLAGRSVADQAAQPVWVRLLLSIDRREGPAAAMETVSWPEDCVSSRVTQLEDFFLSHTRKEQPSRFGSVGGQ